MRIGVIEDEKPIREGLMRILSKLNPEYYVAGSAENGEDGLRMLEQEQPDMIFLDIQMPDMDGLEMLKVARERGLQAKTVILTAYSDFAYAKKAISLGIENYLLKPVNLQELRKTMEKIESELAIEQQGRRAIRLERLLEDAVEGRLKPDGSLETILAETYGITREERMHCLYILLRGNYDTDKRETIQFLEDMKSHKQEAELCWAERKEQEAILVCFYHVRRKEKFKTFIKRSVIPSLSARIDNCGVFTWKVCKGISAMAGIEEELTEAGGWNLLLGDGVLIDCDKIDAMRTYRFAYPAEIENRARRAVIRLDSAEFVRCFQQFMGACLLEIHRPQEIREDCIRYAYGVINTAKECGVLADEELLVQNIMKTILGAMRWDEIMEAMLNLFSKIKTEQKDQEPSSAEMMVKRAQSIIKEYYSQGINLEETARRLHVSEEYLGKQLKKETGLSFTEIIKKYRIDQIKRLLLQTDLKLNQIASMTGYSDPKYMSKVFRAEVGMLPNEYRRINT